MFELLLELLLELFFEAAFEFVVEILGALILRGLATMFETFEFDNPFVASIVFALLGGVAGGLSLVAFPHPLFRPSRVPGLSVVISPILTGFGMSLVGKTLRNRNKKTIQIENFGYGFAFAFGMALVRFIFTK